MELLGLILFYVGLTFLSTYSEPMILLKRMCGFKEEEFDTYNKHKQFFHKMLYCAPCSGFWITLILSQSLHITAIVYAVLFIYDNKF